MAVESLEGLCRPPLRHMGAACLQPCLRSAGHASEPSRPVSSSPPGCSARLAPAKSSEARGSAGWMGSNCQQSQRCTDVSNKFLGVSVCQLQTRRAHSYSSDPIPLPLACSSSRLHTVAEAPSFLRSKEIKPLGHAKQEKYRC